MDPSPKILFAQGWSCQVTEESPGACLAFALAQPPCILQGTALAPDSLQCPAVPSCAAQSRGVDTGGSAHRTHLWPMEFPQRGHQLLTISSATNELPKLRHLSTSQEEILPPGLSLSVHLLQRPGCRAEMTSLKGILVRPFLEKKPLKPWQGDTRMPWAAVEAVMSWASSSTSEPHPSHTAMWLFPWTLVLSGQDKPLFLPVLCHPAHLASVFHVCFHSRNQNTCPGLGTISQKPHLPQPRLVFVPHPSTQCTGEHLLAWGWSVVITRAGCVWWLLWLGH